jgi:hypothetical protein
MSYDVSVFLRGLGRDDIRRLLRDSFQVDTTLDEPGEGAVAVANVFGASLAVVHEHGMVDDLGIRFTEYPLQVSFKLYAGRMPAGGP